MTDVQGGPDKLSGSSLVGRTGAESFAGRGGYDPFDGARRWRTAVLAIDWTRTLIEARGRHAREHGGSGDEACGPCLRETLLAEV